MSQVLNLFNTAGPERFSATICQIAPYFSTLEPKVTMLRPGCAEARVPLRKEVTNHLGTMHAIALCNAAELVAGTMTDASLPAGQEGLRRAHHHEGQRCLMGGDL